MSTDPADEHVKTVYAHYGLALYLVQCLQHGLANVLVYLDQSMDTNSQKRWSAMQPAEFTNLKTDGLN